MSSSSQCREKTLSVAELVNTPDIDAIWPLVSKRIVACLEKTPWPGMCAGDLYAMCRSGACFLIVIHDNETIIAESIWRFEDRHFACLLLSGGGASHWIAALYAKASEIASTGGAVSLRATGRTGLGRALKRILPNVKIIRQTYEIGI